MRARAARGPPETHCIAPIPRPSGVPTRVELDVYKDWLGIPEAPRPPDHYTLLRLVQFEDDFDKVEAHYKKLNAHVRKYASGQYMLQSQDLLNELAKAKLCLTDPVRKRDYDEGLGREFPEELDEFGRRTVENILREQGHITRDQAKELVEFADARGLSLRDAAVQMELVDTAAATRAFAMSLNLPYLDLEDIYPDDSVLDKVPRSVVKRNSILPLFVDDGTLLVACVHEPTAELEDEMRLRFGIPMKAVIATPRDVNQAISKYYVPGARDESAAEVVVTDGKKKKAQRPEKAKPARKPASQVPSAERAERKNVGIIILCWGMIGPLLVDQLLLKQWLFPTWAFPIPFATILIAPVVVWYVFKVYWK